MRHEIGAPVSSLPEGDDRRVAFGRLHGMSTLLMLAATIGGVVPWYWEARDRDDARKRRAMSHTVTLIPGDGIGPEVTEAVLRIIAVAGVSIEWVPYDAGLLALERHGTTLPSSCSTPFAGPGSP